MGFDIEQTFISLYMGEIPDNLHTREMYLLKVLLAASKKAITRKWLQKDPPTVTQWIDIRRNTPHGVYDLCFKNSIGERSGKLGKMGFVLGKGLIQRCQCN
jgi:hypothetical protein